MNWMFVSSPSSYVKVNVIISGEGTFGRQLVHEGGDFMKRICAFMRKDTRACSLSLLCALWEYDKKTAICKAEGRLSPDIGFPYTFVLDFAPSRTMRNKNLSHNKWLMIFWNISLWYFVIAAWIDWASISSHLILKTTLQNTCLCFCFPAHAGNWGREWLS